MQNRLLLVAVFVIGSVAAYAQKEPSQPTDASFLQMKIDASRSPIAMDTEAGVSAEIRNVSSVPVLLREREAVFVTMPEMRVYGEGTKGANTDHGVQRIVQGCATFPTQHGSGNSPAGELLLQPNDSYRIFWDLTSNGCTGEKLGKVRFWDNGLSWFEQKWQRVSFVPGKYTVYLDVVLYPNGSSLSRTATSSTDVEVSASQQMVLLGSFLGGILAYVIKWYYGVPTHLIATVSNDWLKKAIGYTEWFFAGLFGAAMAILASRLSDTFPVKVSANDFWGAVTLGFIFQWIGVKLLEKLPGLGSPGTS